MASRSLVLSLHDVSPRTRVDCETVLRELAELGVSRTSLLVIPDHHHRGHFLADESFCHWLRSAADAGHEIVMHGYYHQRQRRPGETLAQRLATRVYTADEGEFFDIGRDAAADLVKRSRAEFRGIGIDPAGFIAPAWLLSAEACEALRDTRCEYTTRIGGVLDLKSDRYFPSQSLVWSVRSAWRRAASVAWNAMLFRRLAANPLLRISVHPVDLHHSRIWRQIRELTVRALAVREALTYHAWLRTERRENAPRN
jgi:predicted deacetylase